MIDELKKILGLLTRAEKVRLITLFILMLVGAALEIASISAIPAFISVLSEPELIKKSPAIWETLNSYNLLEPGRLLVFASVCLIIIFLVKNAFMSYLYIFKSNLTTEIQLTLSYTLLAKYFVAPYTFHLQRNSMDLFSKVYDESRLVITSVLVPFIQLCMDGIFSVAIIGLLFIWDPFVSIITFVTLGITGLIFFQSTKRKSESYGSKLPFLRSELYKSLSEGLSGLKDAHILNREQFFLKRTADLMKVTFDTNRYLQLIAQLTKPFIETVAIVVMVLVCVLQLAIGRDVNTILPLLTLFAVASIRLLPTVNTLVSGYSGIRNSMYTVGPVYNDFVKLSKYRTDLYDNDQPNTAKQTLRSEIDINNISFTYPGAASPSLQHVSLEIKKGEAIAFVGSSGAGKTTLVDILLGLLHPDSGIITIDGRNIFDDIRSWQKNIGYIPQHIYLADNTIRRNIAFGIADEEIDEEKLRTAISAAQLEDLIGELPNGMDTEIGERGVRFSGGQKQRIGIARALYHNPQVLVMDEATSALDNVTERYIVEAIERLKGDRTIITIAHRLTTVKNCDCLYLMKKGRIIAQGTYEELLTHSIDFQQMNI